MRFEIETITPQRALQLLDRNYPQNRDMREHRCAHLSRAMEHGKFLLTHQAIAISPKPDEWLLDGQHRLRAIILANTPVKLVVAYDVPVEVYSVLDSGMSRTMSERLKKPRKEVTICTTLFRLLVARTVPHEYEVDLMLDVFCPAIKKLNSIQKTKSGPVDAAPYTAAIVLRIAHQLEKRPGASVVEKIQANLDHLRKGRVEELPPVLRAFYRQVHEGVRSDRMNAGPDTDKFCRAWRAFDPDGERATSLQINDHAGILKEARGIFNKVAQDIFE